MAVSVSADLAIRAVPGIPVASPGDDLADLVLTAVAGARIALADCDVLVVCSKLVSRVEGVLAEGRDRLDALAACFPAGTVSGAPKIRAMEIIAALEQRRRGVYAGAVGYLDFAGNLDFCIAIRTVVIEHGRASVQAGAGIVADSVPAAEYDETRAKARAVLAALELAQQGL